MGPHCSGDIDVGTEQVKIIKLNLQRVVSDNDLVLESQVLFLYINQSHVPEAPLNALPQFTSTQVLDCPIFHLCKAAAGVPMPTYSCLNGKTCGCCGDEHCSLNIVSTG